MHELSPGPVYGLPSMTGYNDHDPRSNYPKNPAFSLSPRREGGAVNTQPGPGQYDISDKVYRQGKEHGRNIQITGRDPDKHGNQNPGPGQYDPQNAEAKTHKGQPAFSFGAKGSEQKIDVLPGPGEYNIASDSRGRVFTIQGRPRSRGKSNSPGPAEYSPRNKVYRQGVEGEKGFTMHGRSESQQGQNIPGPGWYNPEESYDKTKKRIVAAGFGGKGKDPVYKDTPGPGTYDPVLNNGQKGFAFRGREALTRMSDTPGPGEYDYPEKVYNTGKDIGRTIRINGRPQNASNSSTPGPGWYSPENGHSKSKKGNPAFSFGAKMTTPNRDMNPGPGHYNLADRNTPYGFSFRGRGKDGTNSITPGPGSYEVQDKLPQGGKIEKPGFTMYGRDKELKQDNHPGPGFYSPESSPRDKTKGPQWSFGDRTPLPNSKDTPGPGAYNPDDGKRVKAVKIHEGGNRDIYSKNDTPGPNYYKIDPNISNKTGKGQPAFTLKGRDKDYGDKNNYPGPGSYTPDLNKETKKDGPMYSFGNRQPPAVDANPGKTSA